MLLTKVTSAMADGTLKWTYYIAQNKSCNVSIKVILRFAQSHVAPREGRTRGGGGGPGGRGKTG
jgi:hypothetical protein